MAGQDGSFEWERHEDRGGDPVCWLPRVCPECGAMSDSDRPFVCARCGAEVAADD